MEKKKILNRLLTGTMVAGAIAGTGFIGSSNLLAFNSLGSGAELRGSLLNSNNALINNTLELKCGADATKTADPKKAEESKAKDAKCGEGKCGEGKCGDKKAEDKADEKKAETAPADKKAMPAKAADSKAKDGKCGEGKCGDKKAAPATPK